MQLGLPGFSPQYGSQKPDLRHDRSRASHLPRSSGISPKVTLDLAKSRSRVPFLTCLFFCSRRWDTLFSLVGHPTLRRQEAARDYVGIDAARAPLARDDALLGQLRQMAGHRAPGLSCGRGERADGGEALPGAVGERHEVLQRPVQMPADGAVQVEGDGNE